MITSTTNDIAGLHLGDQAEDEAEREKYKEQPGLSMKQEELLAKVRKDEEESARKNISLIVVGESLPYGLTGDSKLIPGHVDAGKSTLMGRLLYEVGELSEKERNANERGSQKIGKGSFAFAWGLDALGDERDR
jgi:elongation factor 1 alpha-like protein